MTIILRSSKLRKQTTEKREKNDDEVKFLCDAPPHLEDVMLWDLYCFAVLQLKVGRENGKLNFSIILPQYTVVHRTLPRW